MVTGERRVLGKVLKTQCCKSKRRWDRLEGTRENSRTEKKWVGNLSLLRVPSQDLGKE